MKRKKMKSRNEFLIKLVLLIATIILVIPTVIQAISLGTVLKRNYVEVRKGETAKFTALFWNTENSSFPVKLTVKEAPIGWIVIIRPDEFTLKQSKPENPPYEKGVEYMNLQNKIIKTTVVEILARVPNSAKQGEYKVIVNTNAGKTPGGISVLTERNFKFTVNVIKGSKSKGGEVPSFTALSEDINDKLTGMASAVTEQSNVLLLFISVIVCIGASWIVKRRL